MLDQAAIAEYYAGKWFAGRAVACLLRFSDFLRSESGVTTVEWVALAAAMVIGSIGVAYIIMEGLAEAANTVANQLTIAN